MRRERVAQRVHVQVPLRQGAEQALDHELHGTGHEPLPSPAHEHRPPLLARCREHDVTQPAVAASRAARMLSYRHDPPLPPSTPALELNGDDIPVPHIQARALAKPYPGRVA